MEVLFFFDPPVFKCREDPFVSLRLSVKATGWLEGLVEVEPPLSLKPSDQVRKELFKLGYARGQREKAIRIFPSPLLSNGLYKVKLSLFLYDDEGKVAERRDLTALLKVEA